MGRFNLNLIEKTREINGYLQILEKIYIENAQKKVDQLAELLKISLK
jgi:hypothetical protein